MPIERIRPDQLRPQDPRPVRGPDSPEGPGPAPVSGPEAAGRIDRVEISTEGRLLAEKLGAAESEVTELTPERAEIIRERIESGFYDTPETIESVARRMIERGDL